MKAESSGRVMVRQAGAVVAVLAFGAAAATAAPAEAPAGIDRQARDWAAPCAACHASEGRAKDAIPVLAGRDAALLLRTLLEFRAGQRPAATVMHQLTQGYTEDELARIARFVAASSSSR